VIAMTDLLLATTPSDYVTPWWPLWSGWLFVVLVLLFAGRPTRTRRILGIAWLGLGLFAYGWAVFLCNGCIEGYADWTSCDLSGPLILAGMALMVGSAFAALWRPLRRYRTASNG
jgi:hypothetical protein